MLSVSVRVRHGAGSCPGPFFKYSFCAAALVLYTLRNRACASAFVCDASTTDLELMSSSRVIERHARMLCAADDAVLPSSKTLQY